MSGASGTDHAVFPRRRCRSVGRHKLMLWHMCLRDIAGCPPGRTYRDRGSVHPDSSSSGYPKNTDSLLASFDDSDTNAVTPSENPFVRRANTAATPAPSFYRLVTFCGTGP